jgi:hypothetical protein
LVEDESARTPKAQLLAEEVNSIPPFRIRSNSNTSSNEGPKTKGQKHHKSALYVKATAQEIAA